MRLQCIPLKKGICNSRNESVFLDEGYVMLEALKDRVYKANMELINPKVQEAPQELKDKHYYRKHGANAYYGQRG